MKKTARLLFAALWICGAFLLGSCLSPLGEEGGSMGTIVFGTGARNLVDIETEAPNLRYEITLSGPGEPLTLTLEPGAGLRATVQVRPGLWTVSVRAYNEDKILRGAGKTTVTASAGQTARAAVDMVTATEVKTWEELRTAVGTGPGVEGKEELILVMADLVATTNVGIARKITVTAGSGQKTISRGGTAAFFTVDGGELTLGLGEGDELVLDGMKDNPLYSDNSTPLVSVEFGGTLVINGGTTLRDNANTGNGGAVYVTGTLVMNGGTITGNESGISGGGIYLANTASVVITGAVISGNTAETNGGGMYNSSSSPTLTNVTISGNDAEGSGGGMYNNGSSPTLTNVTISGNTASNGGGMYNNSSSPTLTNVTIRDNQANEGGGMYNYNNGSSPTLTNVTISGNTASNGGGGMHNDSSSPTLTNVTISGNEAGSGGGMYNGSSTPTLTNVIISGNHAEAAGGGMYNIGSSSPTLTNVTISGNTVTGSGDTDGGGGMYNFDSNPKIRNSIIWGNTAGTGDNMLNVDGSEPEISYSLVEGSIIDNEWLFGTDSGNNIDTAPLFVNWIDPSESGWQPTTGGNYRLKAGSPAINTGSADYYDSGKTPDLTTVMTDLDGRPRFNGQIDMGAYEY
jgi:hypothetical protein